MYHFMLSGLSLVLLHIAGNGLANTTSLDMKFLEERTTALQQFVNSIITALKYLPSL
jgi:hypothetical protein